MFGSEVLEVAIGLIFVYLFLALVCTVLVEWIARVLALRSNTLYAGIKALLTPDLARKLYDHPLIRGYAPTSARRTPSSTRSDQPSYIPSHLFATALFQILPSAAVEGAAARASATTAPPVVRTLTTLEDLRQVVADVPETDDGIKIKRALLPLVDQAKGAKDELAAARENVEAWFDNAMDRVSGQYTRKAQLITIAVALALTAVANADSFVIADTFNRDQELREAVVGLAQQTVQDPAYDACLAGTPTAFEDLATEDAGAAPTPTPAECDTALANRLEDQVAELGLPLGWSEENVPNRNLRDWSAKVAGLLFTGFAVSLGAPFWFDLLKRFVNIRATGKVPEQTASAAGGATGGTTEGTTGTTGGASEQPGPKG